MRKDPDGGSRTGSNDVCAKGDRIAGRGGSVEFAANESKAPHSVVPSQSAAAPQYDISTSARAMPGSYKCSLAISLYMPIHGRAQRGRLAVMYKQYVSMDLAQ